MRDPPYGAQPERQSERPRSRRQEMELRNLRTQYLEAKIRMGRMKTESESNKKMLLEMSGLVTALQDISVDYDRDEASATSTSSFENVQRKIRAIDDQMKSALLQCGHLEEEKTIQTKTLVAQECQIRTMEDQISILQSRLKQVVGDKRQNIAMDASGEDELEGTIKAQEEKILALEAQLHQFSVQKRSTVSKEIEALKQKNESKYAEINELDRKLQALRDAQNNHSRQVDSIKEKKAGATTITSDNTQTSFYTNAIVKFTGGVKGESPKKVSGGHRAIHGLPLDVISEEEEDSHSPSRVSTSYSSTSDDSTEATGYQTESSIKITTSLDEGVEVSVGKKGKIDVYDVSYSTDDRTDYSTGASSSQSGSEWETASSNSGNSAGDEVTYESGYGNKKLEEVYNTAMARVKELETENRKLRQNHGQALSNMAGVSVVTAKAAKFQQVHEELKKGLENQKTKATLANAKHEKLRREHAKTLHILEEERAKHSQLVSAYGKVAHRHHDIDNYEKLKKLHHLVVLKLADLGEDNETLLEQRDVARQKLEQVKSQSSQGRELLLQDQDAAAELEATKMAYSELQQDHTTVTGRVDRLCHQYEKLKTKYIEAVAAGNAGEKYERLNQEYEANVLQLRELEASADRNENLKQEYAEALEKVVTLEQSNEDLVDIKEKFNAAGVKAALLERKLDHATKQFESTKKKQEVNAAHLRDVIHHYKTLEQEHTEVNKKLQELQDECSQPQDGGDLGSALGSQARAAATNAKFAAFERRIKELQQQRDAAVEQLQEIEEELRKATQETKEATEAKKAREQDLKTIFGHYKQLQVKHAETASKVELLESEAVERKAEIEKSQTMDSSAGDEVSIASEQPPKDENGNNEAAEEKIEEKEEPKAEKPESPYDEESVGQATKEALDKVMEDSAISEQKTVDTEQEDTSVTDEVNDDDETDSVAQLLIDMEDLKRQKEEKMNAKDRAETPPISNVSDSMSVNSDTTMSSSTSPQNDTEDDDAKENNMRIAKQLGQLAQANNRVQELEKKEVGAKAQLEIMERKVLVAQREAEDAKQRKQAREGNLRDVIAKHKRLEQDHKEIQGKVVSLQEQLEQAKKEARMREEDAKIARTRSAGSHNQYKKLQAQHGEALELISEQTKQLEEFAFLQQ
jgi:hypothetical protein